MAVFPVKNFLSTDTGAPTSNGVAGAGIAWLDALLIDGFNLKSLTSLTQTGGVATGTTASAHGYRVNQVIEIAGATPSGFNGQFMVSSVTSTTFSFAVDSGLSSPATGSITAKVAPLGWTKAFTGTNKAAYRSADVGSTQCYLRVDDTNAQYMLVRGYKTMTDVDTGTDPFPTVLQQASYAWKKSSTSDSTARKWSFFGDSMMFCFALAWSTASGSNSAAGGAAAIFGFGDFITFKPGDVFNAFIFAHTSTSPGNPRADIGMNETGASCHYSPRAYTQAGTALRGAKTGSYPVAASGNGSIAYPNGPDNGLLIGNRHFIQDTSADIRGIQPAIHHLPQSSPMTDGDIVINVEGYPNKIFMLIETGTITSGANARTAVDINGAWR